MERVDLLIDRRRRLNRCLRYSGTSTGDKHRQRTNYRKLKHQWEFLGKRRPPRESRKRLTNIVGEYLKRFGIENWIEIV